VSLRPIDLSVRFPPSSLDPFPPSDLPEILASTRTRRLLSFLSPSRFVKAPLLVRWVRRDISLFPLFERDLKPRLLFSFWRLRYESCSPLYPLLFRPSPYFSRSLRAAGVFKSWLGLPDSLPEILYRRQSFRLPDRSPTPFSCFPLFALLPIPI